MKQRIFISSVQKEFAAERVGLKKFIEANPTLSRFFSVFVLEKDIPATDQKTDEVYLGELKQSDIYIGLVGNEYGFEDAEGVSPTEREFDEATRLGVERLIFVKGANDAERHTKEQAFLRKISPELIRRRYSGWDELLTEVYASLDRILAAEQAYRQLPFDASPCDRATIDDMDPAKIKWFIGKAAAARNWRIPADATVETILKKLHLLHDGKITNAGVLLFAKDPQEFMLTSEVKCMHYHGTMPHKPIPSYQIYHGSLFDMIDQAVDFALSKIDRAVGIRDVSNQAPVTYEIPREVVIEAIVNAVCHRDYTSNASVQVMLFSDRLEVLSPGPLTSALTIKNLSEIHESYPVNPLIADPLFLTQYAEKAGSGTTDMIDACHRAGLPSPEFRADPHRFVTILYRAAKKAGGKGPVKEEEKRPGQIPATSSKTGPVKEEEKGAGQIPVTGPVKTRDEILALLRNDPTMTIEEVCKKVGITQRVTERHFERLKKDGIIKRIGSDKVGYWKILKEPGKK